MVQRYKHLRVRAFGRRLFIKAGGIAALTTVFPGCTPKPEEGLLDSLIADVGGDVPLVDAPGDTLVAPDYGPDAPGDSAQDVAAVDATTEDTLKPCDAWKPDPTGEGVDSQPWVSQAPAPGAAFIPPITDNALFYVTAYFGLAPIDPCTWKLEFANRGEVSVSIDLEGLLGLEAKEREHTLQCVESAPWLMKMDNAVWSGLPLSEVLKVVGMEPEKDTSWMRFLAADGYELGLPVEELETPVWLVWKMNGELLPTEHGFPARLLCPNRYGWQNVKQIVGINFADENAMPDLVKNWTTHHGLQGLVANPESVALSPLGESIRLLGKAYAGSDPITWVGVSADGGETFMDAELTYAPGPDRWTLWRFDWTPPEPGTYTLKSACTTASGATTIGAFDQGIPYVAGMMVSVEVS